MLTVKLRSVTLIDTLSEVDLINDNHFDSPIYKRVLNNAEGARTPQVDRLKLCIQIQIKIKQSIL